MNDDESPGPASPGPIGSIVALCDYYDADEWQRVAARAASQEVADVAAAMLRLRRWRDGR